MIPPTEATARRIRDGSKIEDVYRRVAVPTGSPASWSPHPREPLSKRLLDVVLAGVGLVASLPVWLLLALAVKLEDGGPVFFAQERVGKNGRRFRSWKFRSMQPRRQNGACLRAELEEERITRVGRVLRATALDELPQLWNIFRGDMSFVGPRALLPEEVVGNGHRDTILLEDVPGFEERHAVRPGLTGLAQVYLSRDASHLEKFRYDLLYARRRSFLLDVRLIVRSIWISVRGRWPAVGKNGKREEV